MSSNHKTISREQVYQGKILSVVKDLVELPNGKTATRDVVLHNGAAAIVPIDSEGNILFVRQYRQSIEKEVLEIPAGKLELGEDPFECAKRELEEETGYRAQKFTDICSMYTSIGFCNEKINIYLAEDLIQGKQNLDEDEFVIIEKYSLNDAVKMIFSGEIVDSKTISGILGAKHLLQQGK